MIVRVDISNLENIKDKTRQCSRQIENIKDEIRKRANRMPGYISSRFSIKYNLNSAFDRSNQIDSDIEELKKLVRKYYLVADDLVSHNNWFENMEGWLNNLFEAVLDEIADIGGIVIGWAVGYYETIIDVAWDWTKSAGEWLYENRFVILETAKDIFFISMAVLAIVASGGAVLTVIGAGIMITHSLIELDYDTRAFFASDEQEKTELMNRSAQYLYQQALGNEAGKYVYMGMNILASVLMLTSGKVGYGKGGITKWGTNHPFSQIMINGSWVNSSTLLKAIGTTKLAFGITYDMVTEDKVSVKDIISLNFEYLDFKKGTFGKALDEAFSAVTKVTKPFRKLFEDSVGEKIIDMGILEEIGLKP